MKTPHIIRQLAKRIIAEGLSDELIKELTEAHGRETVVAALHEALAIDNSEAEACEERLQQLRQTPVAEQARIGALFHAAVSKHPGWQQVPADELPYKLDPTAPDPVALVEWFQKTYPQEARAIEREIEGDAP